MFVSQIYVDEDKTFTTRILLHNITTNIENEPTIDEDHEN
jgi:hypothetical protein